MGILRAFSGLRVAGLLLATAALAGCAVAYGLFVVGQQQYLTGRNFRLLSTLSRQFDNTVQAEARILESLARAENTGNTEFSWPILRQRRYSTTDVLPVSVPHIPGAVAEYRYEGPPAVRLHVLLRRPADKAAPAAEAFLTLERLLVPILTPKIEQGAFDTIVLANGDGDVLFARGRRVLELESSGLAALFPAGADKEAPRGSFGERARTTTVENVSIADVGYKLFMQPCCAPTVRGEKPLVMVGLIQSSVLKSQSWAISTTVVKLAVMVMLLILIGWPFLKLWLIGDRQQVRVADLFQLGVSSVAGLAIVTIVLLDVAAYWQLNRHRDAHLRRLAEALDSHATREIGAAQRQLACLERHTSHYSAQQGATFHSVLEQSRYGCGPDDAARAHVNDARTAPAPSSSGGTTGWAYPFFETFSLIDDSGIQKIKLATTDWVPSPLDVSERPYFKAAAAGRGWTHETMCPGPDRCTLESIWSWTTGEPEAVLARRSSTTFKVASIAIPMRSLIRPVLPPGFEYAVIDRTGRVLFHSDRRRNVSENFFEETDDNRRLRAQVGAHSEEPLNLRYWGASYRAYVKPMQLPDTYVVAMYQKPRAWAINREWLVVALVFLTGYLALWLVVALLTLLPDASWLWPDPARRTRYYGVVALHAALVLAAILTAWNGERNALLLQACVLPVLGWGGTFLLLRKRPVSSGLPLHEPVAAYSLAAVLLLFVSGVLPGALLFLASFQIHMQSYIKNSQLVVANALSSRVERLSNEYDEGRQTARAFVGRLSDDDLYFDFLYDTCIREQEESSCPGTPADTALAARFENASELEPESRSDTHEDDMVLGMLEDYLPYYSEASVEWRELLHDHADDGSWDSESTPDGRLVLELRGRSGRGPVLVSTVPSLLGPVARRTPEVPPVARAEQPGPELRPVATSGRHSLEPPSEARQGGGVLLLVLAFVAVVSLTWAIVYTLMRRIFLVGVTEPLWVTAGLAANAGDNIFVRRDEKTRGQLIKGTLPLKLGQIVRQVSIGRRTPRQRDEAIQLSWRKALIELDRHDRAAAAVLVDDFDEDLDDAGLMERKLTLLEELVADPSRTVILVSQVSPTGLGDSLRGAGGGGPGSPAERWRRLVGAFTVVDWRGLEEPVDGAALSVEVPAEADPALVDSSPALEEPSAAAAHWRQTGPRVAALLRDGRVRVFGERAGPVRDLLSTEGRSHPFVRRVCADLLESEAVRTGQLTREQAFDEIGERADHCYRRIWESCSDDQKVVLGHIAQHGLANASARRVVRRLLGRRLLHKDPALRPMNETFRRFVLTNQCRLDVALAEASAEPSAWDRLRFPLAIGVVGVGLFLFATQKELYNAILGVTTAAAVSVPTLIRTVSMLAGRRSPEGEGAKA